MSSVYGYELFFDWNSVSNQDTTSNTMTITYDRTLGDALDNLTDPINVGDSIYFNVLNVTEGATVDDYTIISGYVIFSASQATQKASSPFGSTTQLDFSQNLGTALGKGPALKYPNQYFPYWSPVIPQTSITTSGNFQFTAYITIQGPDGNGGNMLKNFRVDPEMVVESVGGMDEDLRVREASSS